MAGNTQRELPQQQWRISPVSIGHTAYGAGSRVLAAGVWTVSEDALIALSLMAILWIGWPLWQIANHFSVLRKLAEKNK